MIAAGTQFARAGEKDTVRGLEVKFRRNGYQTTAVFAPELDAKKTFGVLALDVEMSGCSSFAIGMVPPSVDTEQAL